MAANTARLTLKVFPMSGLMETSHLEVTLEASPCMAEVMPRSIRKVSVSELLKFIALSKHFQKFQKPWLWLKIGTMILE